MTCYSNWCLLNFNYTRSDYDKLRKDKKFMTYDLCHCNCFREYISTVGAPTDEYRYFLTFTKRPDVSTETLEKTFDKFVKRAPVLEITKLWYTKEHWDSNAHIHCYIESTRSMPRSRYSYYEKQCGKIDKQKAKGTLAQIEDYMTKESEIIKLL